MASRDRRFEGRFVSAVRTTGVYCRVGCPAPLPKPRNVLFFAHAAAAEEAGFRPCRRCRPELSPIVRTWPDTSKTVTRAVRLIAGGALDGHGTLDDLADRLGMGQRQLRRLFAQHLGASPGAVAQSRRVHVARRLLDETALGITEVALSAGFSSIRRFNAVFRRTFGMSPSEARSIGQHPESGDVCVRLPFVPPYDWESLVAFLAGRAIPGVEATGPDAYRRSMEVDGVGGGLEVRRVPGENCLQLRILAHLPIDLVRIVDRIRRLFDLDCDPQPIVQLLARDARLKASVKGHPGLRVPGAWDPFEMAVRAILGQQVSVRGASTLAGRLADAFGKPAAVRLDGITRTFPAPAALADADVGRIGMPEARAQTIRDLSKAILAGTIPLDGRLDLDGTIAALTRIRGIGPWTAHYIAMRAVGEPDALPAGDLGLKKALARNGHRPSEAEIRRTAEAWRPFRSYAVVHLWLLLKF
jgi:AraC family transcriptional regulator of adaptative response / DNA-3-methyladenine glycosylase II